MRSRQRKKFRQEISFFDQRRCMRDFDMPPTNNSSTPISRGIFLKGFLA